MHCRHSLSARLSPIRGIRLAAGWLRIDDRGGAGRPAVGRLGTAGAAAPVARPTIHRRRRKRRRSSDRYLSVMGLVLVEGIPGSGKSSTSQWLAGRLGGRWWYEEEAGHPIYVFDDAASLRRTVDDLAAGRHRSVVEAALAKWSAFAPRQRRPLVLDGCLFGYLTWSLFWADAPDDEVADYVSAVGRRLRRR